MNLIINKQLNQTQEKVLHELTMKKRQGKKSTMSEKQVLARKQLAHELLQERKAPHPHLVQSIRQTLNHLDSISSTATTSSYSSASSETSSASSTSNLTSAHSIARSISSSASSASSASLSESSASEASLRPLLTILNEELEVKLHQYEYLVAQEKALLGAYNMVLFTNEGVNNFQTSSSKNS